PVSPRPAAPKAGGETAGRRRGRRSSGPTDRGSPADPIFDVRSRRLRSLAAPSDLRRRALSQPVVRIVEKLDGLRRGASACAAVRRTPEASFSHGTGEKTRDGQPRVGDLTGLNGRNNNSSTQAYRNRPRRKHIAENRSG